MPLKKKSIILITQNFAIIKLYKRNKMRWAYTHPSPHPIPPRPTCLCPTPRHPRPSTQKPYCPPCLAAQVSCQPPISPSHSPQTNMSLSSPPASPPLYPETLAAQVRVQPPISSKSIISISSDHKIYDLLVSESFTLPLYKLQACCHVPCFLRSGFRLVPLP